MRERSRETTGAELAERLGISQPTLAEHLSAAERKLLSLLLERANRAVATLFRPRRQYRV